MIDVDFYVLKTNLQQTKLFICRLIEESYIKQKHTYLFVNAAAEAKEWDNLLWTFREESFLPHCIYNGKNKAPIQIGTAEPSQLPDQEILLNLTTAVPVFYKQFNHIIEIVLNESVMQQLARSRYLQYRHDGCKIATHK